MMGGTPGCRRLAVAFYARVALDPILRPLFPGKTFKCAIDEFSAFLVQFLGGPGTDTQSRWWLSLRESHQRFKIGPKERAAWMANMIQALEDVPIDQTLRTELRVFFQHSSAHLVNQGAENADKQSETPCNEIRTAISLRWHAQTVLDKAAAALRAGDAPRAIALAESPPLQSYAPAVPFGLLVLMIRSSQSALLEHVLNKVSAEPALLHERYGGRTLLHEAAAVGSLTLVELLLGLGIDPDVKDAGGHTPLYAIGNQCFVGTADFVVRVLVRAGAHLDACDGVKRCTALHMAARRGNVQVARALLDCGAAIEARDSAGESPLRRAVNCDKVEVAALLIARGADIHSIGSKGLTPRLAARSAAMKRLLQSATSGRTAGA
jgi:hemoglobin